MKPVNQELAFLPEKRFMLRALELARQAAAEGEVPVGAVVVRDGRIVGEGRNRRETQKTALGHAELDALSAACETLGDWRLSGCVLYVTLEPCPMCMGAAINARIDTVVYGAEDEKAGCCGSVTNLAELPFSHKPALFPGFCEEESRALLRAFFGGLRNKNQLP